MFFNQRKKDTRSLTEINNPIRLEWFIILKNFHQSSNHKIMIKLTESWQSELMKKGVCCQKLILIMSVSLSGISILHSKKKEEGLS